MIRSETQHYTDCDSPFSSDLSGSSLMTRSSYPAAFASPSTQKCFALLWHLTFAYICCGPLAAKSADIIDFCVTCRLNMLLRDPSEKISFNTFSHQVAPGLVSLLLVVLEYYQWSCREDNTLVFALCICSELFLTVNLLCSECHNSPSSALLHFRLNIFWRSQTGSSNQQGKSSRCSFE